MAKKKKAKKARATEAIETIAIIGVDPGVATGISTWFEYEGATEPETFTLEVRGNDVDYDTNDARCYTPTVAALRKVLSVYGNLPPHQVHVVCEEFTITKRTIESKLERASLIIRDWLAIECAILGYPFTTQTAAEGKTGQPMKVVKGIEPGLWAPGQRHSQDSSRHIVQYLRDNPTRISIKRFDALSAMLDREFERDS